MIEIGIIGSGPWAKNYLNALLKIPNVRIMGYARRKARIVLARGAGP